MWFFDPIYLLFAIPPLLLGLWAQFRVQSAFRQYSKGAHCQWHDRCTGGARYP